MIKIKKNLILAVIVIIAVGALIFYITKSSPEKAVVGLPDEVSNAIIDGFTKENIEWEKVSAENDTIMVSYSQPTDFEMDELFANWAYIMQVSAQNSPESIKKVVLECDFENGDKLLITASTSDITSFQEKDITAEEFFSRVEVKPLTQGPRI